MSMLNSVFCVEEAMVPGKGEDSFFFASDDSHVIIGAFDGCGGIGSRRYNNYSGCTGAYVASRSICGGVESWFKKENNKLETLPGYIKRALKVCDKFADKGGRMIGSLGKSFPTTAAIVHASFDKNTINASYIWAGDSRCYLLDADGLHQLTKDDVNDDDALSNISGDGVLTNVICSSSDFQLHKEDLTINHPCVLISATDGCFGYLKSPMHFEYLLTNTLMRSENLTAWKKALAESFKLFTGDDYTLCAAVFGFDDFRALRDHFSARNAYVYETYIQDDSDVENTWQTYKSGYYSFMKKK